MLSIKFGYGLPAAFAAAFALDFLAADIFLGLPSPFGRGLSQTSPPFLYIVTSSGLSLRTIVLALGIFEGATAPIPRLAITFVCL